MSYHPIATFRVHPNSGSLYYTVFVWPNLKALRHTTKAWRANGVCNVWTKIRVFKRRRQRLEQDLGQIHLTRRFLGVGTVSHECTHAALGWACRVGCKVPFNKLISGHQGFLDRNSPEERFCWVLGNLCNQVYNQLYDRGILK